MAKLGISTGTVPNDGTGDTLLSGAVKINSNFGEIYNRFGDGTNLTAIGGTWVSNSIGIHTLKNVGIGTTNPRFTLEVGAVGASGTSLWVNGNARVTGILTIGTSSITLNGSNNTINIGAGVTINGNTGIISATSIILNGTTLSGSAVTSITAGSGISIDQSTGNVTITATGGGSGGGGSSQWVTTAAGIHTLSNVGVGTTNPTSALTVSGNVNVTGVSTFSNTIVVGTGKSITFGDAGSNYLKLYSDGSNTYINQQNMGKLIIDASGTQRTLEITDSQASQTMAKFIGNGGAVELYHAGSKKFETLGAGATITGTTFTNQLSVSGVSTFVGNVGIGTTNPTAGVTTANTKVLAVGIVTAATLYGDASNTADGRWILGASGSSDFTFTGVGFTETANDPTLYLSRGKIYEFVNNSGGSHPFRIQTSYQNTSGTAYSNGVTNNAASTGTIRFEVPFNAPNILYYQCTNHTGMAGTIYITPRNEPAVGVRTTVTGTTGSIGSGSTANLDINGFKSYGLLKVGISSAAWVVLYTDSSSRTSDESRSYLTDPTPGSGVLAEVRTTTAGISTFLMTPGIIGWNNDVSVGSTIYARVTNNESSTSNGIALTLTVVKLED